MEIDEDTCKDLMDAFQDLQGEVEDTLRNLLLAYDLEELNKLFRAIHNIKGNAGMMGLTTIVDFTHEVEEVAGALRQNKLKLTESIGETFLLAMDRLHDLHRQELFGKKFDHLRVDELKELYREMAHSTVDGAEETALRILNLVAAGMGGDTNEAPIEEFVDVGFQANVIEGLPDEAPEEKLMHDLFFFQEFALQLDTQINGWEGRSIQMFDWAMKINQIAGSPIDSNQLAAAVYIHDLGISVTPRKLWEGKLDFTPEEVEDIRSIPYWGYNFLVRIPGWEEAATIVHHHRECVDGTGYPSGLKCDEIHAGAKILAILDAFFLLTKGRVDASARHSTARAVSTINARIDTQYEGLWVQCFNHMIRKELKAGFI